MKIAISGKQGAGKTTLANELMVKYNCEKMSFADGVKKVAQDVFGLTYEQTYGHRKNRELLQGIGKKMRELDPLVWVKMMERRINDCSFDDIVIDDVRFKNEFDMLKEKGFTMIRIEATEENRRERIPYFSNQDDISETDLDDIGNAFEVTKERFWDVGISNNNVDIDHFKGSAANIHRVFKEELDN